MIPTDPAREWKPRAGIETDDAFKRK